MGLLKRMRAERADERELGTGLWRRARDRYRRAVDRFHQVMQGTEDDELYAALLPTADRLGASLDTVREICARCQLAAPEADKDIPAALEPTHRALSMAANEAAAAAQAAAMARYAEDPLTVAATAARRVDGVLALVERAERSL